MTPNELVEKAIYIYLEKLKTFQHGTARQQLAKNLISQPFGNHDKLIGARSATAVDKEITNDEGENKAKSASDSSQQGPESETATAVDKEDTNEKKYMGASDPSQTGLESEVTNSGDPSKNGPEVETGSEMVSPGEGGPDDGIDPS